MPRLGDLLLDAELITEQQLKAAHSQMGRWDNNLARTLLEMHLVPERELVMTLGRQFGISTVDLYRVQVDPKAREMLDHEYCREKICVPFAYHEKNKFLDVAIFDPAVYDEIRHRTKCNVRPYLAVPSAILDVLDRDPDDTSPAPEMQFKMPEIDELERATTPAEDNPVVQVSEPAPAPAPAPAAQTGPTAAANAEIAQLKQQMGEFIERTDRILRYIVGHLTNTGLLPHPTGIDNGVVQPAPAEPSAPAEPPAPAKPAAPAEPPEPAEPPVRAPVVFPDEAGARVSPPEEPAPPDEIELPPIDGNEPSAQPTAQPGQRPQRIRKKTWDQLPINLSAGEVFANNTARETSQTSDADFEVVVEHPEPKTPSADNGVAAAAPAPAQQAQEPRSFAGPSAAPLQQAQPSVDPTAPSRLLMSVAKSTKPTVAMDFGTTRSSVGTVIDGQVEVLRLPGGEWDMPSVIGFRRDGSVVLGKAARAMLGTDPTNAISSPKRILGRRYDDPSIRPYLESLAMGSMAGPNGEVMLQSRGRQFTPMEACAHILYLLRLVAQRHVGHEVKEVLLTTPVSFVKPQYDDLRRSAELAGLTVADFVDEPTAASLSNLSDEKCSGLVAVYDFGGGTFDFTVTEVSSREVKVLTTAGDTWLGGDDLDEALAAEMANAFWRQHGVEIRKQAFLWQRLLVSAEQAKRNLSDKSETVLSLSEVAMTAKGTLDMRYVVTRSQFSQMTQKIIAETLETCKQAMEFADLKVSDLNAVYLSGGTCYIPAVREAVARFFNMEPRTTVPPERSVLVGAVLHGAGVEIQ